MVTLATDAKRDFDGYLARPPSGTAAPGIVVLSEMFGLNGPMRAVADGYASRGFAALVPNLFWRSEVTRGLEYEGPDRELAWARLKALDLDAVSADVQTAVTWLRRQPFCTGKVAGIGFCGGGRIAFLAAARTDIDAAASLYGLGISSHLGEAGTIRCPLQIHYGMQDQHVPREEVEAVTKGVQGRLTIEVFLYPEAGHSFFNPVRPTFDAAAAKLAAERIDRMLAAL